jgi:hypothetical protein
MLGLLTLSIVSAADNSTDDLISADNGTESEVLQSDDAYDSESTHSGYWVLSKDRDDLDLDDLKKQGVTDVLLNFKSYEVYGKDDLESWISNASEKGIRTHIWTQIFWTSNTSWVNPMLNNTPNTDFFSQKIDELNMYASIKGLSGIHMDYLRYSGSSKYGNAAWQNAGGKEAISSFVIEATTSIRQINPNLTISAAIMPELNNLERTYGVEYDVISRYLDVIIPMVYTGNYNKDRNWIFSTTKAFVDNSKGAKIWTGLQAYLNDNDLTPLSISQMNGDIKAAVNAGASGTVIFRYGVSENIDFDKAFNLIINIDAKKSSLIVTKGGNYKITLKDSNGNPVPGENVRLLLNGKSIASTISNSKGIAKIKITSKMLKSAKIGENVLTIKLVGGKSKTVNIKVKKDKPKLKVSKNKKKLKITLKNSANKAIKKAKITIKIKGKSYKVKTNSKGKAALKINRKGKISIKYSGNKYYKAIKRKV